MSLIELARVTRRYGSPPTTALDAVSVRIDRGESVAIVGPSGSGKSTMLNLMGTLDLPSDGVVRLAGRDVRGMRDRELSGLRAATIGFVFQQFHLAEGTTALDNVADGLLYRGVPIRQRRRRAADALEIVGLGHRLRHKPNQLSGGERQRVAIARAVVGRPPLLLADEPTGNLDTAAGAGIVQLLDELHDAGTTVVVITHDLDLARRFGRQVEIRDGRIVRDTAAVPA